jgi:hypothetical protein
MFKVGDKVVIVDDLVRGMDSEEIGKVFTVKKVEEKTGRHYLKGSNTVWFDDELHLYNENEVYYRVEDRVTYVFFNGKVGKAKCHPDDKFDITTGILVALTRLKSNGFILGDHFFYVNEYNEVESTVLFDSISQKIAATGNAYHTREEAEEVAKRIKEVFDESH